MKTKASLSLFTLSLIALLLVCGVVASAQDQVAQQPTTSAVPNLIRYGGVLKDANGAVLASQTVGITFALYKQQDGGVALWTETRNVTTDAAGQYNVMLGSTKPEGVPAELFSDQEQRWLAVQVQGQPEPTRVLLVSVPYAFKAHEAETLGGLPASAFVKAAPDATSSGYADAGITVNGLSAAGKTGSAANGKSSTVPPAICTPVPGAITYWDSQGSLCPSKLFQNLNTGNIGIGLTNPSEPLDVLGEISTYTAYDINEHRILSVKTLSGKPAFAAPTTNLFVGWQAGGSDTLLQNNGSLNTFTGFQSGFSNNPGAATQGFANTYNGAYSGWSNRSGFANTMLGTNAGFTNTDSYNTCVGSSACQSHNTGGGNTMVGNSAGQLDANGKGNSFFGDQAGSGNVGDYNTFLGDRAGTNNRGNSNTFSGYQSGFNNRADNNAFYGYQAGLANTAGAQNTFLGISAGASNTTGGGNTYVGWKAGFTSAPGTGTCCNTFVGNGAGYGVSPGGMSGAGNSYFGHRAGEATTNGGKNTFSGFWSGLVNTTGSFNTFYGDQSGQNNIDGSYNTFLGTSAAGSSFTTGDNNTCVGAFACDSEDKVSNNIEIGNSGLAPEVGTQTTCVPGTPCPNQIYIGTLGLQVDTYVQGIYDSARGNVGPYEVVCVDPNGKLFGVFFIEECGQFSSIRVKNQIANMGDSSSRLLQLRPVTFFYKAQYGDGSLQYGLIAEEVAKVYPELVVYEKDGTPLTVKYHLLAPMLLNEFQKQHAVVTAQQTEMQVLRDQTKAQQQQMLAQQQEIEGLKSQLQLQNAAFQERLSRLESLVTIQVQTAVADKTAQPTPAAGGGLQ